MSLIERDLSLLYLNRKKISRIDKQIREYDPLAISLSTFSHIFSATRHTQRERVRSNEANEKRYFISNKIKGKFEIFIIFNLNEKYSGILNY
jgi:hypothetical protein